MTPGKKQAFEPTGLIPRSIVRTFERFYKQLLPRTKYSAIREYRISRYQVLVSIRCLCTLLILPLVTRIVANWLIFPQIQYFWDVTYQDEHVFSEIDQFSQVIFFDSLLDRGFLADNKISSFLATQPQVVKTTYYETSSFDQLLAPFYNEPTEGLNVSGKLMSVYSKSKPSENEKKINFVKPFSKQSINQQPIQLKSKNLVDSTYDRVVLFETNQLDDIETLFLLQDSTRTDKYEEISIPSKVNQKFNFLKHPPLVSGSFEQPASYSLGTKHRSSNYGCNKTTLPSSYALINRITPTDCFVSFPCSASEGNFAFEGKHGKLPSVAKQQEEQNMVGRNFFVELPSFAFVEPEAKWDSQYFSYQNFSFNDLNQLKLEKVISTINLDYLDHKTKNLKNKVTQDQALQEKIFELAQSSHFHALQSLTNVFADLLSIVVLIFLLITLKPEITILKSFLVEVIYNLSDTTKSFLLILMTDLLVGFHSPRGWETMFSLILYHFGLPENQDFVFLFVATLPVILDTVFKYWIFRHLNKISPSTVATYHNMIE